MKSLFAALLLSLTAGSSAFGFGADVQALVDRYKANKPLPMTDVALLMAASERWCYAQEGGQCGWSDIYLAVSDSDATYEIANAWTDEIGVAFTDRGVFRDNRYICETDENWEANLRAFHRADNTLVMGRDLQAIKDEIAANRIRGVIDCFDYLYLSTDPTTQTITLLQRQYTGDVYDAAKDVEVTLHFDEKAAAGLGWY